MDSSSAIAIAIGKKSIRGGHAILNAASTGNHKLLKRLVNKYVKKGEAGSLMEVKDIDGRCALNLAASEGKTQVCKYLIEQLNFDVDVKDEMGDTPLLIATKKEHYTTSCYLLNQGAKPSLENGKRMTALHYAAKKGQEDVMHLLIAKGADVEALSDEGTPLHCAISCDMKDAVKVLLDNHADPNSVFHLSPLMVAVLVKSVDCVKLLLKAGADPDRTSLGDTPLVTAATTGGTELIECLLQAGANPNVTDFYGVTAIEIAAREGNVTDVIALFQVTTPIERIPDWSCDGILKFVNSYEAKNQYKLKAEDRFREAKENGDQAFQSNEYSLAIFWYRRALDSKPLDATVLSNRNLCWERLNERGLDLEDAIACAMLRSDSAKVYHQAGVALSILANYREAVEAFKMGLMLDPGNKDLEDACRDAMKKYLRELLREKARLSTIIANIDEDGDTSTS